MQSENLQEPLFPVFVWEHGIVEIFKGALYNQYVYEGMKFLSDFSSTWWLILIPLIALVKKYGSKIGFSLIGLTGVAVLVCDMISYRLIKAMVARQRPDFYGEICAASECWGFVSSHASNTFCAATLLTAYLGRKWAVPFYSLATLISFSRVYLGKHYPLDVVGGALLGLLIGVGALALFDWLKERWRQKVNKVQFQEKKAFARHTFFVVVFTAIFCLISIFY
ncbi:MAG: phosphatase PAP2 family protein, partial [Bdellovibrionaceae bacterium]|nr:phosphatase PAP2 family protein [Pseudobdellovibrionaceae bacterium]